MSTPKPSDLPHQLLREVKRPTPLERSVSEVAHLLDHWQDLGYNATEAIQLADITLNNVIEES